MLTARSWGSAGMESPETQVAADPPPRLRLPLPFPLFAWSKATEPRSGVVPLVLV